MYKFPGGSVGKESACNGGDTGDVGSSPGLGRGRHSNPLQYSYLENPMDRGAWWATVPKNQTRLKQWSTHTHLHN